MKGIGEFLPFQNPLNTFVHNNPMQPFERFAFPDALLEISKRYRAKSIWSEHRFRKMFQKGRIEASDLRFAIEEHNRKGGRQLDEMELIHTKPIDAGVLIPKSLRVAQRWERGALEPFNRRIHDLLIPFISVLLDQGMSDTRAPFGKNFSLWGAFCLWVDALPGAVQDGYSEIKKAVQYYKDLNLNSSQIIEAELKQVDLPLELHRDYLEEILFDLPGWGGMIQRLAAVPEQAPIFSWDLDLLDWLAVRLLCEHSLHRAYIGIYKRLPEIDEKKRLSPEAKKAALERLMVWQAASERAIQRSLISRMRTLPTLQEPQREAQILFCMDDREESLRRRLELVAPEFETFGVPGFFYVDMKFKGYGERRRRNQCPPVVQPRRHVDEVALDGSIPGTMRHTYAVQFYSASRTELRGLLLALMGGLITFVPMMLKASPRLELRLGKFLGSLLKSKRKTKFILNGENGFSLTEQADIVRSLLVNHGPGQKLAKVVVILGHGSTMTNNPFRQAYGCGACGGNHGAPNSRAFCEMANDANVRAILKSRGFLIPDETVFVSATHDTCSDEIELKSDLSPPSAAIWASLKEALDEARKGHVMERMRWFADAPANLSPERALEHAIIRSRDLAQPRPEYGHSRVAACIVGRRSRYRGADLDRRAFLVSYDPAIDFDGTVLEQSVMGTVPVAANIALDYYFSTVDTNRLGAGSKLPLNVTSLLGVMTGSKSDLRFGLATQMTEIHEPLRPSMIVEATRENVEKVFFGNDRLKRLTVGKWIHLIRLDPDSDYYEQYTACGWQEVFPTKNRVGRANV